METVYTVSETPPQPRGPAKYSFRNDWSIIREVCSWPLNFVFQVEVLWSGYDNYFRSVQNRKYTLSYLVRFISDQFQIENRFDILKSAHFGFRFNPYQNFVQINYFYFRFANLILLLYKII